MNGSFIIPEKFKLNKKRIVVIVDDDYCKEEGLWGEADFTQKSIILCHRSPEGRVLKKSIKENTFFHELVHQILDSIGEEKLKYDERFVELFADRLCEYEKTKQ